MALETASARIIVIRHAKAEGYARDDAARRLTDRGVADAAAAGRAVAAALDADRLPGSVVALVSSAARTRQTWEAVAAVLADSRPAGAADGAANGAADGAADGGADGEVDVRVSDDLYQAGVDEVVEMLRQLTPGVTAVIVVGHNPTMAGLLLEMSAGTESPARSHLSERGMPTASVGVLSADAGWAELEPGGCRLEEIRPGRA
jgi:phosphohistidine phosphatase